MVISAIFSEAATALSWSSLPMSATIASSVVFDQTAVLYHPIIVRFLPLLASVMTGRAMAARPAWDELNNGTTMSYCRSSSARIGDRSVTEAHLPPRPLHDLGVYATHIQVPPHTQP